MKSKVQLICLVVAILASITGCSNDKNNNETATDTQFDIIDELEFKENNQEFKVEKDKITIHFELYDIEEEKLEDGTTKLSVEGFSESYDENSLPFLSYVLALPQDTALKDVEVLSWSDTVHIVEHIKLTNLGLSPVESVEAGKIFESTSEDGFKIKAFVQKYQGIPVVYVSIYPIVYDEKSQQVKFIESGEFQLNLKNEIWDMSHYDSLERVKNVVDNPETVDTYKISEK